MIAGGMRIMLTGRRDAHHPFLRNRAAADAQSREFSNLLQGLAPRSGGWDIIPRSTTVASCGAASIVHTRDLARNVQARNVDFLITRRTTRRRDFLGAGLAGSFALALGACTEASAAPLRLSMRIEGHGPAVVFESGLGEGRKVWAAVVNGLTRCFTTVTYDRLGIGESAPRADPNAPVLASRVSSTLLATLRRRHLFGPYILVGHSLAGLYVQAFARTYPLLTAGVVLVDATSPLEPPGVFVSRTPLPPGSTAAAEEAGVARSVAALLKGPSFPPIPLVVIAATDHGAPPKEEALWLDVQRRTARMSSKGRLVIVHGGHSVPSEQPAAVLSAVLSVAAMGGVGVAACRRCDSAHGCR